MEQLPPEIIDCRNCGQQFNLNAQYYYTNLCPSCEAQE